MTDTLTDVVSTTVTLDAFDLAELTETGMVRFRIGDQDFELRTGPRPTDNPYSLRVTDAALDCLREGGEVVFRRGWGRLTVTTVEEAR